MARIQPVVVENSCIYPLSKYFLNLLYLNSLERGKRYFWAQVVNHVMYALKEQTVQADGPSFLNKLHREHAVEGLHRVRVGQVPLLGVAKGSSCWG